MWRLDHRSSERSEAEAESERVRDAKRDGCNKLSISTGLAVSGAPGPTCIVRPGRAVLGISPQRNVKFHRILGKCKNFNSLAKNRSPILEGDFRVKKWEPKIVGSACLRRAFPKCCETYPPFVGKYPILYYKEKKKGGGKNSVYMPVRR